MVAKQDGEVNARSAAILTKENGQRSGPRTEYLKPRPAKSAERPNQHRSFTEAERRKMVLSLSVTDARQPTTERTILDGVMMKSSRLSRHRMESAPSVRLKWNWTAPRARSPEPTIVTRLDERERFFVITATLLLDT
jgi:hypothetical protein